MIHLSQEFTHLDVMRIVCNSYVLMYIQSYVAAKNGAFQFCDDHRDYTYEDSLLLKFILNPLFYVIEDLSRILELTVSTSRLGEDCKELLKSDLILLTDTADRILRKHNVASAEDQFLLTHSNTADVVNPQIEFSYLQKRYLEYILDFYDYTFLVEEIRVSTSI